VEFFGAQADATVTPLGNRAFRTSATGNARGNYAVDLQMDRGGDNLVASGNYSSIGGGLSNNASATFSNIGGGVNNSVSSISSTIGGGAGNSIVESSSSVVAGGTSNVINDSASAAIGGGSTNSINSISDNSTIAGGSNNSITGDGCTIAGGISNSIFSTGNSTVGGGTFNQILGAGATVGGGRENVANADFSAVPGGIGLSIDASSTAACAVGRYNLPGEIAPGAYRIFMVGNGDGPDPGDRRNIFSVATNNDAYLQGTLNMMTTADYAEYFESEDKEKYPIGTSVVFTGENGKIRKASKGEVPFGVISERPSVAGNSGEEHWSHKYIRKEVEVEVWKPVYTEVSESHEEEVIRDGRVYIEVKERLVQVPVMEEVDIVKAGKVIGKRKIPKREKVGIRKEVKTVLNPDFNPALPYIPRSQRPEWNLVGILGVLKVLKSSPKAKYWKKIGTFDSNYDLYFVH
jgi:hypothetical protein